MEMLEIKNLNYTYPQGEDGSSVRALNNISLTVREGEFVILAGLSGSGKSTLLRLLKPQLAQAGELSGDIILDGRNIREAGPEAVGYVAQDPDSQIVTDKVWHEIAFGLENLGVAQDEMRRRVSEMAACFGLEKLYHKETATLSGGEKQLLNLAGVMVMRPRLLILDEPTSQLDPIAAKDFIQKLRQLNDEYGTTIILAEHRLEESVPLADRLVILDKGELVANDRPEKLYDVAGGLGISAGLPVAMQLAGGFSEKEKLPISVKEGRSWLRGLKLSAAEYETYEKKAFTQVSLEAKDVWFGYERNERPIIRGVNLKLYRGEIYCILGGNGSGKSTLMSVLAGGKKPFKGKVLADKKLRIAWLPQNPDSMFLADTVREDYVKLDAGEEFTEKIVKRLHISQLLDRNPYDLSGGELQLCALGRALLTRPDCLLLDEPTKGMDPGLKGVVTELLRELAGHGMAIMMVTHDVDLAAHAADYCSLCFDGGQSEPEERHAFFTGNSYYTTAAHRLGDPLLGGITVEELRAELKKRGCL